MRENCPKIIVSLFAVAIGETLAFLTHTIAKISFFVFVICKITPLPVLEIENVYVRTFNLL